MTEKWVDNEDPCPRCEGVCQNLLDENDYHLAERCENCRWVVRFDNENEEIKAVRY